MKTEFRPRVPQVRCWKCGKLQISALCHHCWRPGCADHVVSVPPWARRLLGREGAGRGPENDEAYHCKKCSHAATRPQLVLGVLGTVAVVAGLILLLPSRPPGWRSSWPVPCSRAWPIWPRAVVRPGTRRGATAPAPEDQRPSPDGDGSESTSASPSRAATTTNLRPVEGKIAVNLVFGRPDRDRLDRYLGKRARTATPGSVRDACCSRARSISNRSRTFRTGYIR